MKHTRPVAALALLLAVAAACSPRAAAPLTSGAGAACEVADAPPPRPAPSAREVRRALLAAAAMDPACWHLDWSGVGELDVTTERGSYSSNSLGVHFGDPDIWAEDVYPGARAAGANRLADARNALWIPAGTRIRSAGCRTCSDDPHQQWRTQLSYVWRCEPDSLAARPRYVDPIALLEERETTLETLPINHVVIEAIGGGSVTQDLHRDVPCSPPGIVVVYAGTLDGSWLTISTAAGRALHRPPLPGEPPRAPPLNLVREISNAHRQREAHPVFVPIACSDDGLPLEISLRKGNPGDQIYSDADGFDFASGTWVLPFIRPLHGSGDILYVQLPQGW